MTFAEGDKIWYFGTSLAHGLYTYKELCTGWEEIGYTRHKISRPERFKIPRVDINKKRAGYSYGVRFLVFEVWGEEIRKPTTAELILYGK